MPLPDLSKMNMAPYFIFIFAIFFNAIPASAEQDNRAYQPAIASAHPLATKAGYDILDQGGNAFDAAVAVSATLGVVEPFGSGIGGGAFFLIYRAETDEYFVVDARETAPFAAHRDMYLDDNGQVIDGASTDGPLSAAIPAMPAAWSFIGQKLGALPLSSNLKPAIYHAKNGFHIDERYQTGITYKLDKMRQNKEAASIFLDNNQVPDIGWRLVQADLAESLSVLAALGRDGFYKGAVAEALVDDVRRHGGIWSLEDLSEYQVVKRSPVFIEYQDAQIIAPPLPSSGGLVLKNIFNILSGYDLQDLTLSQRLHIIIEAMKHGYHNRALYMGDSDFVDVPVASITSMDMADKQRNLISLKGALPSQSLKMSQDDLANKGTQTTHFSVMDAQGNMVAVTQSLNYWFGSNFVAQGTGILLNNQMDDFTMKSGVANGYGLVGTAANEIAPQKRMLSSMTPLFVKTPKTGAILGTPGGSRIISMNLLATLGFLNYENGDAIVSKPRFHHQYLPDKVIYEDGAFSEKVKQDLVQRGHVLEEGSRRYGNMQMIIYDRSTGKTQSYSDPRGQGRSRVY